MTTSEYLEVSYGISQAMRNDQDNCGILLQLANDCVQLP